MKFQNNCLLSFLLTLMMVIMSPIATANSGKIANATDEEVKQALVDSIKIAEQALASLRSGADEAVVSEQINDARQLIKRVENNRLDVIRTRSATSLKNARQAMSKNDRKQAEEDLTKALKGFKEMQNSL